MEAGGPSFGKRQTRRERAGELGVDSAHLAAMNGSKDKSRSKLRPVGLAPATLPTTAQLPQLLGVRFEQAAGGRVASSAQLDEISKPGRLAERGLATQSIWRRWLGDSR